MTRKFIVTGGPSREDLFDCLRLDNRHNRMFPVRFKIQGTEYPLFLTTLLSLERCNRYADDHLDWIVRAEDTKLYAYFKAPNDTTGFHPYWVKIIYNTHTRQGTAFVTRVRSKK